MASGGMNERLIAKSSSCWITYEDQQEIRFLTYKLRVHAENPRKQDSHDE